MSIRAIEVKAAGSWREEAVDTVVLDFDDRHRRRIAMKGIRGLEFLLDLPEAIMLRSGDALALEDGRLVDAKASWGFGLTAYFLGVPWNFDFARPTDLKHNLDNWQFTFYIGPGSF